jgi:hypothetical protein
MGGYAGVSRQKQSLRLASFGRLVRMLQWKPKLIVLVVLVVLVAALLGQFTWEGLASPLSAEQFTW